VIDGWMTSWCSSDDDKAVLSLTIVRSHRARTSMEKLDGGWEFPLSRRCDSPFQENGNTCGRLKLDTKRMQQAACHCFAVQRTGCTASIITRQDIWHLPATIRRRYKMQEENYWPIGGMSKGNPLCPNGLENEPIGSFFDTRIPVE
jgi:hypothetical protein